MGEGNNSKRKPRHEIELEKYVKKVQIEARIMGELCTSHILPPSFKYQNTLIQNIIGMKEIGLKEPAFSNQKAILEKISEHISEISSQVSKMIDARKKANVLEDTREKAIAYCDD